MICIKHRSYGFNVKLQARRKRRPFLVQPTGPWHHGYLETDMHHDLKDPATGCIKVRGEGSVIRSKARGGDVAEKSLVGRPCNRILEKLGKTGCPLSPFFPPLQAQLEVWAGNSCYKNSFFFFPDIKTSPGPLKYFLWMLLTPARCCIIKTDHDTTLVTIQYCLLDSCHTGRLRCPTLSLQCL